MRKRYRLNAAQPSTAIDTDFDAVAVVVTNPTASPIYFRQGSPDVPTRTNADTIIPAATAQTFPANGFTFAVGLGDPTLLTGQQAAASGLFSTATVEILGAGEEIPSYGIFSFASLSLTDLTNGLTTFAGPSTSAVFDLQAWGGALLSVLADTGSGQGVARIEVSSDAVTFRTLQSWAFWPNIPIVITLPRVARYLRVSLLGSGIAGQPALAGVYSARATLQEIQQISYTPSGASITSAYAAPSLGEQAFTFVTVGMPSISIGVNNSTGTRGELIVEASQSPAGPWRLVSFREQSVAGTFFNSIYRSVGNLDLYTRVRILDIGSGGITGTLTMSTPLEPDLTAMLNNIFAALGDIGQPVNVNQSIYHELDNIRVESDETNAWLGGVGGVRDQLVLIHSDLDTVESLLNTISLKTGDHTVSGSVADWIETVHNDIGFIYSFGIAVTNVKLDTLHADLDQVETKLDGIDSSVDAVNTSVGVVNGNVAGVLTQVNGFNLGNHSNIEVGTGALAFRGFAVPGDTKLLAISISTNTAGYHALRIGTAGVVGLWLWDGYLPANGNVSFELPWNDYINITGQTGVWFQAPAGASMTWYARTRA